MLGDTTSAKRMTLMVTKSERNSSYYMVIIIYVEQGDKYLLTLKDVSKRAFLCKRQELPRDYVLSGVPVEDLDDPTDVLRILKERLAGQVREEAHLIKPVTPTSIDKSFFQAKAKRSFP